MKKYTINCKVALSHYQSSELCLAYGHIKRQPFIPHLDAKKLVSEGHYHYERWVSLTYMLELYKQKKEYRLSLFDAPAKATICNGIVLNITALINGVVYFYEIQRDKKIIINPKL